jgi:hypothetical protein
MSEQEAIRSRLLALAGSVGLRGNLTVSPFEPYTVHGSFVGVSGRTLPLDGSSPEEAEGKLRVFVAEEKQIIAARKLKGKDPDGRGKKGKGYTPPI